MKFLIKKIYIILFLLSILFGSTSLYAKDNIIKYSKEDISNYFFGTVSANQYNNNAEAFKYFNKIKFESNRHSRLNTELLRTLILLEKFKSAFIFSEKVEKMNESFFEADLLLGLNYFLKKDYISAEKYFKRLSEIPEYKISFGDFIGNILMAWNSALSGKKEDSFEFIKKVPKMYNNLIKPQNAFLQCYFDTDKTNTYFKEMSEDKKFNFSRYNYFYLNYLLFKNKFNEAENVIKESTINYSANLLLKQTQKFYLNKKYTKIKSFFNCKNPKDSLGEFFYVIANLYSHEKNYKTSNFYLKISLYLNKNFLMNKSLLAENFSFQKQNKKSKDIYYSLKKVGSTYSWYASKNIARILQSEVGKKYAVDSLQKDFNLIKKPNFLHYYELANFYKDNEFYNESIEYYSIALKIIEKDHFLIPKILDRRGTSFERVGDWKSAETDLLESLKIIPEQAHVLNYLAYTWIDKGINLDKGLEMLKKALKLSNKDAYIIDSLGWVYYAKKDYEQAEFYLRQAVELMPSDPTVNDHYGDVLWMLNKNIQARYFWKNILSLDDVKEATKASIRKKLIFGISKKL